MYGDTRDLHVRTHFIPTRRASDRPNALGKSQADAAGEYEARKVDRDGYVTEGTSSNAWIVTADDRLLTRPASHAILNGITRLTILRIAAEEGVTFEERAFPVAEAMAAREAFVSRARKSVVKGKGGALRVSVGGRRNLKKK